MCVTCSCCTTCTDAMSVNPKKFCSIGRPLPVMLYKRNIKTGVYVPVCAVFTLTSQLAQRTLFGVLNRKTNTSMQLFTNNLLHHLSLVIRIKRSL